MSVLSACPLTVLSVSQSKSILLYLIKQRVLMYFLPNQSGSVVKLFTQMLQVLQISSPYCHKAAKLSETMLFLLFQYISSRHFISLLSSVFLSCLMLLCIFVTRRELLSNPMDFLPRAAPCPPPLTPSAPKQSPRHTNTEHSGPVQAR